MFRMWPTGALSVSSGPGFSRHVRVENLFVSWGLRLKRKIDIGNCAKTEGILWMLICSGRAF